MADNSGMQGSDPQHTDERITSWFNYYYLKLIIIFLFVFALLPIAAPAFMKVGMVFPARIIYSAYGSLCHQLPYRSWFLFGRQTYYPLAVSSEMARQDFAEAFNFHGNPEDAQSLIGSATLGYKMAVCQRDFAIYVGLVVSGLGYALTRKRIRKIPFWIWLVVGVLPLGVDGLTQLASTIRIFQNIFPVRESAPWLRTITGALFGLTSGLYVFPSLEATIRK